MELLQSCTKPSKYRHIPGTDEKAIISILTAHDNEQRREIANLYKQMFGKVGIRIWKFFTKL